MSNKTQPYSLFSEMDVHLFKEGKHFKLHDKFGSKVVTVKKQKGVYFSVWAPSAKNVSGELLVMLITELEFLIFLVLMV